MPATTLIHAMLSDRGQQRRSNEDACLAEPDAGVFVVCDGMGGAAGGEVASHMASTLFLQHLDLSAEGPAARSREVRPDTGGSEVEARLRSAICATNTAIHRRSVQSSDLSGMGTTLVALLHAPPPARERRLIARPPRRRSVPSPDLFLVNVGDSRCYRMRAHGFIQLSTDHSFVEEQVRAGQISAAEAAVSPMRNFITRALGPHASVEPDVQSYRSQPGDVYLLCSDGLTRELEDDQIEGVLRRELPARPVVLAELQQAARQLVDTANQHGGGDNITVLLLAVV